jgi:hypothetical protein
MMLPLAFAVLSTVAQAATADDAAAPEGTEPSVAEQADADAPAASAPADDTPAPAPVAPRYSGRQRLLILNLEAAGVDPNTVTIVNGLVTQGLARSTSLEVITSADLGALVDLEAERVATGCDTTSCLAEIAGAMGTRYVVFGTVGRLGDVTLVQMSLFDSEAARPIGRKEVRATDDGALLDAVPDAARVLVSTIVAADDPLLSMNKPTAEAPVAEADEGAGIGLVPLTLLLTGGGVAALSVLIGGVGTTFFVVASSALTDTSGAVSADLKNNFFRPLGPFGAIAGGLAIVGFGLGAAVATAGFFVE